MLNLNVDKCVIITFQRKINDVIFKYKVSDQAVRRENTVNDLGVTFDRSLNFDIHYDNNISKALRTWGFVQCNMSVFSNVSTLTILYKSLVRPLLEYCSSVWSPYESTKIDLLEKAQHRFLRFASCKSGKSMSVLNHDYIQIMSKLNLTSLEYRQTRSTSYFYTNY